MGGKVTLICGRSHSRREQMIFGEIKRSAEQGGAVVIVPDQYSFEFDKLLYEQLGARLFNRVQTNGINAISEKLCREFGSHGGQADAQTSVIAMYRAQSRLKKQSALEHFNRSLLRPTFVRESIELVKQLMRAGATPETLRIAAESSPIGSARLRDISKIYAEFNSAVEELGCSGMLSLTAQAAAAVRQHGCFKDSCVFFEGFTSFSADESSFISSVICQAKAAVFGLLYADDSPLGPDVFAQTAKTRSKIEDICKTVGIPCQTLIAEGTFTNAALDHIDRQLYAYQPEKIPSEGAVRVAVGDNIYQECDYVFAEISRLIREEGAQLGSIAVICGGFEENSAIAEAAAQRHCIPCFSDKSVSALTSVPAKYLMSILDAVITKKYRTDNILRIIKSPLSPILDYDACYIEDFCVKWRVEGDMWRTPFILDTDEDTDSDKLERIEAARQAVMTPLDSFKTAAKDASVGTLCEALFELLDALEMPKHIYSQVRAAAALGDEDSLEVSRGFKQVWQGMITSIKRIYDTMKDDILPLRAFSELIKLMLSQIRISAPPQKSDCVRIAEAGRSRLSGVKTLFMLHVNDGVFPHDISASGLISAADIDALSKAGAELETKPALMLDSERMSVYMAASSPSERLYLVYAEHDRTGARIAPSQLPLTVGGMFSDDVYLRISQLPVEFFCTGFRSAFYKYLEHSKENTRAVASIKESVMYSEEYSARLAALHDLLPSSSDKKTRALSPSTAAELFFPNGRTLSATKLNDFYKCPYLYFCKYGLLLSTPSPAELDNRYFGLIAHRCLEAVMSRTADGKKVYNEQFPKLSNRALAAIVNKAADDFVRSSMGGTFGKDLSFNFVLKRLKRSVLTMAVNLRDEMKNSRFIPIAFEYDIKDNKPLTYTAADGRTADIALRGFIDRMDIYRSDKGDWLRITDYKTGEQTFDKAKIYHGLDLQMLIYLLAAMSSEKVTAQLDDPQPAGVMYSHIRYAEPAFSVSEADEYIKNGIMNQMVREALAKSYKPDGVMLGDEVDAALNKSLGGAYTIFSYNGGGERSKRSAQPITLNELKALEQFALEKAYQMTERLSMGDIAADPIQTKPDVSPCAWCDHRGVCPNPDPKHPRCVSKEDKDKLAQRLKEISKKEGGEDNGSELD